LLIGDAAGIVNPFNAEGIAYAMESGRMAAGLVADSLVAGRPALAQMYPAMLREQYGRYFSIGSTWARWIGNPKFMHFGTKHGLHRKWLMTFAMRLMANLSDGPQGDVQDKIMYALELLGKAA
jgi:flavin-dependent dehydrogenase